jgi:hypothetical protein
MSDSAAEQAQIDDVGGPPTAPAQRMTRRDRIKPAASITSLQPAAPRSAWARDLLYGGALGGAALVLALAFSIVGPTARRREPRLPAPARAQARRRE